VEYEGRQIMAYFANGTDGQLAEARNCDKCKHNLDMDDELSTCPILFAHLLHNYTQCSNKAVKEILEILWPMDEDGFAGQCSMFEAKE